MSVKREFSFLILDVIVYAAVQLGLLWVIYTASPGEYAESAVPIMAAVIACTAADLVMYWAIHRILLSRVSTEDVRHQEELLKQRLSYYSLMSMRTQMIRRLYHDLSNHINTISLLRQEGKEQEAADYTERIRKEYAIDEDRQYCRSRRLNMALNVYHYMAAASGADGFKTEITVPVSDAYENEMIALLKQMLSEANYSLVSIHDAEIVMRVPLKEKLHCEVLQLKAEDAGRKQDGLRDAEKAGQ